MPIWDRKEFNLDRTLKLKEKNGNVRGAQQGLEIGKHI